MRILYTVRKFLFGSTLIRACSLKKKSKFQEKIDDVLDWFYDFYTDLLIIPYERCRRFIYWGWKLRYNYDFECHFLYYMTYLKLKGMIDYSRKHGTLCWNSKENGKEFRRLKIACQLAKRLWKDDYHTNMHNHDGKWGENNMVFRDDNRIIFWRRYAWNPELEKKEKEEWHKALEADEKHKANEKKYYYKLLEKHLERWWD